MLYILDTDHISLIARGGDEGRHIVGRLSRLSATDQVAVTIISYEEQMRGWLADIADVRKADRQGVTYARLQSMLHYYCGTPVLPFDNDSIEQFHTLWLRRLRIGTMDLKIAAIALANHATLLTRNITHFDRIPELKQGDWSVAT